MSKPFSIIVERERLFKSIKDNLIEAMPSGELYFDDHFVYTDENDVEHHIQHIRWTYGTCFVLVNEEEFALRMLNLPILTMIDYKVKKYVSDYLED